MKPWQPPPGWGGRVVEDAPLARRTTWRMGGATRWLAQPEDGEALRRLLASLPDGMPRLLLGGGSNVLMPDEGFYGVVVDLTAAMTGIEGTGEGELEAQAGVDVRHLAHVARLNGLSGLEFLAGIPGSVGGALRMNAGAYGGEVAHILEQAEALDPAGRFHWLGREEMGLGYRRCAVPSDWIFTRARFRLQPDDPAAIRERMRGFNRKRVASQPLNYPSAGSVFKNPPGGAAWKLIEAAGLRGERMGEAQVSEKHCNFFINRGEAKAREMRALIDLARERVLKVHGVTLQLEVRIAAPEGWVEQA